MITGKEYQHIKDYLAHHTEYDYRTENDHRSSTIRINEIYLDTDADFTRHPEQFARVSDNLQVQAKIVYEE